MRNTKRVLSMLTALAMTASAFSGMCISASAEDTVITATLAHTASAQGGANTEATYLDEETHYYNNWGSEAWAATAYADFTFDAASLPTSSAQVISATLTTQINCIRGTRNVDIGYVPTSTVDLTGATAAECTIPMIAKTDATILASYSDVATTYKAYTVDATDAIKAMISNGESEVVFAYSNGTAGGYIYGKGASADLQPTLTVTVADASTVFHKVTVNQVCGDEEIATNSYDVKEGDPFTPDVENSFSKDGYKYTIDGALTTIESVSADETITVNYTKRELVKTTASVNGKSGDVSLGTVATTELTEDVATYAAYPKYVLKDGKLYMTEKGSSSYYSRSLTGTTEDQSFDVEYTEQADANALYYIEAEDLGEDSGVSNSAIRCSNGAAYKVPTESVKIATLSAGTYTVEGAVWGSSGDTYTITAGDTTALSIDTTGSIAEGTGESFTLTEDTELSVTGTSLHNSGLDYILIKGEGTVTPVEKQEPEETTAPEETTSPDATATPEPTATPVPANIENVTYLFDDFSAYTETGVSTQGTTAQEATMGNFKVYVGNRGSGGDSTSTAAIEDGALKIVSGNYATSSRGASIALNTDVVSVPNFADIADGAVLNYSFKAKFTDSSSTIQIFGITSNSTNTGGGAVNDPYLSITNNSNIPLNEWVSVNISVKNDKSGCLTIYNEAGNMVYSTAMTASGDTFEKIACYGSASTVYIDDFSISQAAAAFGIISASVMNGETPVEGVNITIDSYTSTTGTDGISNVTVPNGTYTVSAAKDGYEHATGQDADSTSVTVNNDTVSAAFTLSAKSYVKIPDSITITDGQTFIAAPKSEDTSSTAAFKVSVLDQYGLPMTSDEYGTTWSIYPAGTETADPNVTIDENGVVTVSKAYSTDNQVAAYDVTAVAATDDRNNKTTATLYVANSDIIYYEPTNWVQSGGTSNRNGSVSLGSAVTLPDMSSVTVNVVFPKGTEEGGQVTLALISDAGALTGIQYTSDGVIKAWTGWTGNSNYNQQGDSGAYTESGTIAEGYVKGDSLSVTFVIDKTNKNITASSGEYTVSIPYTIDATSITGFKFGQYRNYGAITVTDITVQEPDNNYLSVNGETAFAKVEGQILEKQYTVGQSVIVPDETFTWTLTKDGKVINGKVNKDTASLSEATYEAVITPDITGTAVVLKAAYDAQGRLLSVTNGGTIAVAKGEAVTITAAQGEKVMLWNESVNNMEPVAEAAIAAEAATTAPDVTSTPEATTAPDVTTEPDTTTEPDVTSTPETTTEPETTATPEPADSDAIELDQNGMLYVTDRAENGVYTITATSSINPEKTASLDVTIGDFQELTLEASGPRAYDINGEKTGTYSISKAVDSYDVDIASMLTDVKWSIDNTSVAEITESGTLTVKGAGTATVTGTVTNGTAVSTVTVPVTVGAYYVTAAATGDSTSVDTSALVTNANTIGYQVTTSKDGVLVNQSVETSAPTTVDTTGADSVEITPVYEYAVGAPGTLGNLGAGYEISVPAGTYNFTVTDTGNRCDVYVNSQLVVNNILQGGSTVNSLYVPDIVVNEGVANITTSDYANGQYETGVNITVKLVKAPSNVERTKKVYVLGDSLTCIYYNNGNTENNNQTGWGQVLQSYIKNADVVDLGNSGVTASGLIGTAFTQVLTSAKAGDIMLLESGYNDRTYNTEEVMKNAVTGMVTQAKEMGVNVILVSPNASAHDYKSSVAWTSYMADVAEATETSYIDLSALSYEFFSGLYGDSTDELVKTYNVSDKLHSTYKGANKMASIVASGMLALGYTDVVDTDYVYTFTDTLGNTINCQAQ